MKPTPESPVATSVHPSPNHGERRSGPVDLLILHYTGMDSAAAALQRLANPVAEVSAHYVVLEDGRVVQMVPEGRRAWHAGQGSWAGISDVNSRSLGIEIVCRRPDPCSLPARAKPPAAVSREIRARLSRR